jgi:hypothetical protein
MQTGCITIYLTLILAGQLQKNLQPNNTIENRCIKEYALERTSSLP